MEDLTGKQLGPYQIVSALGEGGMAAVYRAYQPGVDRYVALKILPQQLAKDPQFVARFEQEAKVLAQLQHPHILQVFDYGEANGFTFIAMPLIKSGTLSHMLGGEPLDYKLIRRVITQVGDALDYAHSQGLVHRDVKPSNVLIDERGNCLLTDFGLAKILEGGNRLTTSGAIMGTPVYMSPEQGMGRPLDGRSDIYSLGVILYEMATGRAPFDAETPMAVVFKHINDSLPPPSALTYNFPDSLERVILKSLAKDPGERYQTASAMVAALEAAMQDIDKTGASKPIKRTEAAIARPTQSAPAFASRRPSQTTRLLKQAWWAVPLTGLAAIIALALVAIIGAVIIGAIPRATPIASASVTPVATESGRATEPAALPSSPVAAATESPPTPDSTSTTSPGAILLDENFESGNLDNWIIIHGKAEVIQLPDGNRVMQMVKDQAEGAQALFAPSFDWPASNYALEADAMVADLSLGETQVQLQTRVQAADVYRSCLYYAGLLGDGWISLERQFVNSGTCDDSLWETDYLAPSQDAALEPNQWYHLRVEVFDNAVRHYLDGALVLSAMGIPDAYAEGGVGLGMFNTSAAYFDNVRVETLMK